jgi:hypothetical protein
MAKMAGEFDGVRAAEKEPEISMTFEVYYRNHPNPPREWLERELLRRRLLENAASETACKSKTASKDSHFVRLRIIDSILEVSEED